MSNQTSQKIRRMASPSTTKQGPMKATQSFGLVHGSPTISRSSNGRKSPSSSPTTAWTSSESHRKTRRSPDSRSSPERCSPSSPCLKGDKSKAALRTGLSPVPIPIKRTNSLDTIANAYLGGEWPKDPAPGICDKSTQTPEEWDDSSDRKKKGSHKRSSSVGNGADTLNVKEIKASLAKNRKEGNRGVTTGVPRTSPIQGNHYALSTTQTKSVTIPSHVHVPTKLNRGMRGSVEGLNLEIEKLTLTNSSYGSDIDELSIRSNAPDGHRAPVTELLCPPSCSVDTQTPSGFADDGKGNGSPESSTSSRSQSESPTMPSIIGVPCSDKIEKDYDEQDNDDKEQESPCPAEKSFKFVREPPDGCERVNLKVEEPRREFPPVKETLFCPIIKPSGAFIPSQQSAFTPKQCPLLKPYVNQPCDMAIKRESKPQDIAPGGPQAAT